MSTSLERIDGVVLEETDSFEESDAPEESDVLEEDGALDENYVLEESDALEGGNFLEKGDVLEEGDALATNADPPCFSVLRVNDLRFDPEAVKRQLEAYVSELPRGSEYVVSRHAVLDELLVVSGGGRNSDVTEAGRQLIVDAACGGSVLRGGDVYAPGVMAAPADLLSGELVAVYADLAGRCRRGRTLHYSGPTRFVGDGRMCMSRSEIFRTEKPRGLAVRIVEPVWLNPSLGPFCDGDAGNAGDAGDAGYAGDAGDADNAGDAGTVGCSRAFLQNLPSALAVRALDPRPGQLVLDMCAAPGGKTTHLAQLMRNQGVIYAFDKSSAKLCRLRSLLSRLRLTCVRAAVADSASALYSSDSRCRLRERHHEGATCPEHGERPCCPPFAAGTFDRVLLDAPCSGLGQRPGRLTSKIATADVDVSFPPHQARLLAAGARLLAPSGDLVYSTCSTAVEENERQVSRLLETAEFAGGRLVVVNAAPRLGRPGLAAAGLSGEQSQMLQRFHAVPPLDEGLRTCDNDTIGFFIAKLHKMF